jgi:homoserine O-acetyltransferase/O-succinyltransferase
LEIGGPVNCKEGISPLQAVTQVANFTQFQTDTGFLLRPLQVAYQTYGTLNTERSNAILICHAFSGDAHAAGISAETGKPGWWDKMIGPGKAFDTDRYFVICSNILAGCSGTTGPASIDPETGKPYALRFPLVSMPDIVRVQKLLVESMQIETLLAVVGGSMGGMQALQWSVLFPDAVRCVMPIATTARHGAQQIAFNEVGRQAILRDPGFNGGDYHAEPGKGPAVGLSVARMIGHITYMSDDSMRAKFGRRFKADSKEEFDVASYLKYRGDSFVDRFDANSYLRITQAMDYFDLAAGFASLGASLERAKARFLVISFTSDWLYPTYQSREIVSALRSRNRDVAYCELTSTYGHDAFLLEVEEQTQVIQGFLNATNDKVTHGR